MTRDKVDMNRLVTFVTTLCFLCYTSKCQDYSSCGIRFNTSGIIIGGTQSRPGMWPWQVAIYKGINGSRTKKFHCGGALINPRWVLSAAHCFPKTSLPHDQNTPVYRYTIIAGDYNIFTKDPNEQERKAFKIYNHPDYLARTYENDLALIELEKSIKMGPNIRTICLPKVHENLSVPGEIAYVAGWGWTKRSMPSPVLRHSAYKLQNNSECDRATDYHFNQSVMFCAGDGKGGSDTCKGYSGGSLVRKVLHKGVQRWVTVGLVSWGEGCAVKGKYGYYTRMEPFVKWIQKKTKGSISSCGNPGNITNGQFSGEDFLVGYTVKYKCNQGYQIKGISRSRCKRNGKWTRAPTCQIVECTDPGSPHNGVRRPRKNKYFYNNKITFRCKTNYTIIGKSAIICQPDGMWNGYKPVCLAPCKDPGIPKGGVRLDHNFRHSQTVRFICKENNQMQGIHVRVCTNGRWDRDIPSCILECTDPGSPRNGVRIPRKNKYFYNNKITFRCKTNYTIIGKSAIVCQPDGMWNGYKPVCLAPCKDPGIPKGGVRLDHNFRHSQTVRFICKEKNQMQGIHVRVCTNGRWDRDIPSCIQGCDGLGNPANGRIYRNTWKRKYNHRDRVRFYCYRGYKLDGNQYITCRDGNWSNDPPTCKRSCGTPILPNGGFSGSEFFEGKKIRYYCNRGFDLIGSQRKRCLSTGQWSGRRPECKRRCNNPRIPSNGPTTNPPLTRGQSTKHGTIVRFSCRARFTLEGKKKIRCYNGRWSGNVPMCKDYRLCGGSTYDPRGRMVGGNKADRGRWPWQVAIFTLGDRGELQLKCGGALISKRWVLTAATCFHVTRNGKRQIDNGPPQKYTIIAGDHNLKKQEDSQQTIQAEDFFTHHNHHVKNFVNDIALIKLSEDIELGPFARTVCLPKKNEQLLEPGNFGIVAGWGATQILRLGQDPSHSNRYSNVLLQSAFTIQSDGVCRRATIYLVNSTVTFCAGDGKGGNDTCQGDSGGSFVRHVPRDDGTHRWVTAGIVSWGEGCGLKNKYAYYTRVAPFVEWIEKTIRDNK